MRIRGLAMFRSVSVLTVAAAMMLAVGCTPAGPTGYRSLAGQYGYEDTANRDGSWTILFYASGDTARDRVEAYILYRAAEVAQRAGMPRFAVMEHGFQTLEETRTLRERPPPGFEIGGAGVGRGDTTLTRDYEPPPSREPVVRLKADMIIRPYSAAPPAGAERLYDTAAVLSQLGPVIRSKQ
jgi:hypothetical protein